MIFKDSFDKKIRLGDIVQIVGTSNYYKVFTRENGDTTFLVGEPTSLSEWVFEDLEKYEESLFYFDDEVIKVTHRDGKEYNDGCILSNEELDKYTLINAIVEIELPNSCKWTNWYNIKEAEIKITNMWDYDSSDYDNKKEYLVLTKFGDIKIASLEKWDEDEIPNWYDNSSEKWNLGENDGSYITHFQNLPLKEKDED